MLGLIGIIALLAVLGLSFVITRLATVALRMTGLSGEAAAFQARSAFTGTGFTTNESESVVSHPVRRRIVMILMILRGAGLLTIVLSLILSFAGTTGEEELMTRLAWLCGGIGLLWLISSSAIVERYMEHVIAWALDRWTDLDVRDYARLLKLSGDYGVTQLKLESGDWLVGREVGECRLRDEGMNILGIERTDGSYVGVPKSTTPLHEGDTLILYGRTKTLRELDERRSGRTGDQAHEEAVSGQRREMARQERDEEAYQRRRKDEQRPTSQPGGSR